MDEHHLGLEPKSLHWWFQSVGVISVFVWFQVTLARCPGIEGCGRDAQRRQPYPGTVVHGIAGTASVFVHPQRSCSLFLQFMSCLCAPCCFTDLYRHSGSSLISSTLPMRLPQLMFTMTLTRMSTRMPSRMMTLVRMFSLRMTMARTL